MVYRLDNCCSPSKPQCRAFPLSLAYTTNSSFPAYRVCSAQTPQRPQLFQAYISSLFNCSTSPNSPACHACLNFLPIPASQPSKPAVYSPSHAVFSVPLEIFPRGLPASPFKWATWMPSNCLFTSCNEHRVLVDNWYYRRIVIYFCCLQTGRICSCDCVTLLSYWNNISIFLYCSSSLSDRMHNYTSFNV